MPDSMKHNMDDRIFPEVELIDSTKSEEQALIGRIYRIDSSKAITDPHESIKQLGWLLNYYMFQHEKETRYLLTNIGKPTTKLNYIEHKMGYFRDKIKRDRDQLDDIKHKQNIRHTKVIIVVAFVTMASLVANAIINYLKFIS